MSEADDFHNKLSCLLGVDWLYERLPVFIIVETCLIALFVEPWASKFYECLRAKESRHFTALIVLENHLEVGKDLFLFRVKVSCDVLEKTGGVRGVLKNFEGRPVELMDVIDLAVGFRPTNHIHLGSFLVEHSLVEVSRIWMVLIKVLKLFRVVFGPGHSPEDVLTGIEHDHIVFGIILFAAKD